MSAVSALVDLGKQGLLGEKGDRKEARKSQRREKELPRRKERRGRKAPEGAVGRAHGRPWKGKRAEAEK